MEEEEDVEGEGRGGFKKDDGMFDTSENLLKIAFQ